MFGLVQSASYQADDCSTCNYLGDAIGASQEGLVGVNALRDMWSDKDKVLALDFWDQTAQLMIIFVMLQAVLLNNKGV